MSIQHPTIARRPLLGLGGAAAACLISWTLPEWHGAVARAATDPGFVLTDAEWRSRLSPWAYAVLRKGATEWPYSSPLNNEHRTGTFTCAGCGLPLFSSSRKFDSRTGWPSFYDHLSHALAQQRDSSFGTVRTEVHCARCAGHLGHVFEDGPRPTGLRYCMNGVAMDFIPQA